MQTDPREKFTAPYPGLRPFEPEEHELFFGRTAQIDQMLTRLETNQFLAVVGSSGSGKSSLVRAGLLPMLDAGMLDQAVGPWYFVILRPGRDPFRNLAEGIHQSQGHGTDPLGISLTRATLSGGEHGLVQAVKEVGLVDRGFILVLVDQFEEIFRFRHQQQLQREGAEAGDARQRNQAASFVQQLLATAEQTEVPIYVVITMRSDFIGDCDLFRGLPEAISNSQFLTPRLTRSQMTEAIRGPLQFFDCEAEDAVVNRILNETGTELDQLPLMQHALMRTWHTANERSGIFGAQELKLDDYTQAGGLRKALHGHAEEAWLELSGEQKMIAEKLFRCLSERTIESPLTRRLTTVKEVSQVAGSTPGDVAEVVGKFVDANRNFIVVSPPGLARLDSTLDIAHEAFLRQWERIGPWIDAEATSAANFRQVSEDAMKWKEMGDDWLWDGPRLQRAMEWVEKEKPTAVWAKRYDQTEEDFNLAMDFLERSEAVHLKRAEEDRVREEENRRKEEERRLAKEQAKQAEEERRIARSRTKLMAGVVLVLSLFAVAAAVGWVAAYKAKKDADGSAHEAEIARTRAETQTRLVEAEKEKVERQRKELEELADSYEVEKGFNMLAMARERVNEEGAPTFPAVQILAGKAIGFEGYGRPEIPDPEVLDEESRDFWIKSHPVLLDESEDERQQALELIRSGEKFPFSNPPVFLWTSPTPKGMRHERNVRSTLYLSGGKRIASGSEDGIVKIWDADSSRELFALDCGAPVEGLVTNAEETWIIVAVGADQGGHGDAHGDPGQVQIWDLETRERIATLVGHDKAVRTVDFDPRRTIIASGSYDHTVRIWERVKHKDGIVWEEVRSLPHESDIWSVCFSSDGKRLATGSGSDGTDCVVRLWNTETWELEAEPLAGHQRDVNWVSFSPDDKLLASASSDYTIRIWDVEKRTAVEELTDHDDQVVAVSWGTDASTMVSCAFDSSVLLWERDEEGKFQSRVITNHSEPAWSVSFSEDGTRVVSGASDDTVRQWFRDEAENHRSTGHSGNVTAVAFSPNGLHLVSACSEGKIHVWNTATGQCEPPRIRCQSGVLCLAMSPDGRVLATGHFNGEVNFYDRFDGKKLKTLRDPSSNSRIAAIAFDPTGKRLAAASWDSRVRIWDISSGKKQQLQGHDDWAMAVAYSPDGKRVASGSDDDTIVIWNAETGEQIDKLDGHTSGVYSLVFTADSRGLISGAKDNIIRIWKRSSGDDQKETWEEDATLEGHTRGVQQLALDPTGDRLVSASLDGTARLWDLSAEKQVAALKTTENSLYAAAFAPDGRRLAVGSGDRSVQLWELGNTRSRFPRHEKAVWAVAISRDSQTIVSGCSDGKIKVFDSQTGNEVSGFDGHENSVWTVALHPDGRTVVSGDSGGKICVWEVSSGRELHQFTGHRGRVTHLVLNREGTRMLSGGSDRTVRLWDLETLKPLHVFEGESAHQATLGSVAFSSDGRLAASADLDGRIFFWDIDKKAADGEPIVADAGVRSLVFDPSGKTIVTGSEDKVVRVWDVKSRKPTAELEGHSRSVRYVQVCADGSKIASGGFDNRIFVWDAKTKKRLGVLDHHSDAVIGLAFSHDGNCLVTGGNDRFVHLCDMEFPEADAESEEGVDTIPGLDLSAYFKNRWVRLDPKTRKLIWTEPWERETAMINPSVEGSYTALLKEWHDSKGETDVVIRELLSQYLAGPAWRFWTELPQGKRGAQADALAKAVILQLTRRNRRPEPRHLENIQRLWRDHPEEVREALRVLPDLIVRTFVIRSANTQEGSSIEEVALEAFNILENRGGGSYPVFEDSELVHSFGIILTRLGKYDEAETRFNQAITAAPPEEKSKILTGISRALTNAGQLETALDKATQAMWEDQNSLDALRQVIAVQRKLNQNEGALESYLKLIRIEKATEQDFVNAGKFATSQGKKQAVEEIFDHGRSLLPTSEAILKEKGWALWTLKDYSGAANSFSQWISMQEDTAPSEALLGKAAALWKSDLRREAKLCYLELLEGAKGEKDFSKDASIESLEQPESVRKILLEVLHGIPKPRILRGHDEQVIAVRFSPDGKRLASGAFDNTIKIWDVETGEQLASLEGHSGGLTSMVVSSDGTRLFSASADDTIGIWNIETGRNVRFLKGHSDFIYSVKASSDESMLASASEDGTIRIWDVESGEERGVLEGSADIVFDVVFSEDGKTLYSVGDDGNLRCWDVATGKEREDGMIEDVEGRHLILAPDGKTIVCGTTKGVISVIDPDAGKVVRNLEGHHASNWIWGLSFGPKGEFLASCSTDETVRLWNYEGGDKSVFTFNDHTDAVFGLDFSPDGRFIASGSRDDTIRLWPVNEYLELLSSDRQEPLPQPPVVASESGASN